MWLGSDMLEAQGTDPGYLEKARYHVGQTATLGSSTQYCNIFSSDVSGRHADRNLALGKSGTRLRAAVARSQALNVYGQRFRFQASIGRHGNSVKLESFPDDDIDLPRMSCLFMSVMISDGLPQVFSNRLIP